ncbi:MAG: glycosyltransferase family 4 protein [Bacteroidales bacterium]|nr:glycosyltransferase family 4 protein [Bacteroidales bacterium]
MKLTNNILILCPYPKDRAPSQRLKFEQYYTFFEENGFKITISSFVNIKFWNILYQKGKVIKKIYYTLVGYLVRIRDLFRIHKFDVVYIHLWATPLGPPIYEFFIKLLAKKIIYDIDDMVFLGHSSEANKHFKFLKGQQKMIYLMKIADHVITCTPYLDAFVRKFNKNTTDISSSINTDVYTLKQSLKFNDPIVIGWSGSHSTSKYLKILEPVFIELKKRKLNFVVHVIGDKNFKFNNPEIPVFCKEWDLNSEVSDLQKFDIGVYPLPEEEWVLGKSGLKAIQYMALGIPTIATAIGANFRIIKHHYNGFLIEKNNILQWTDVIIYIANNYKLAKKIGINARNTVIQHFSVEALKHKYLQVLENVMSTL